MFRKLTRHTTAHREKCITSLGLTQQERHRQVVWQSCWANSENSVAPHAGSPIKFAWKAQSRRYSRSGNKWKYWRLVKRTIRLIAFKGILCHDECHCLGLGLCEYGPTKTNDEHDFQAYTRAWTAICAYTKHFISHVLALLRRIYIYICILTLYMQVQIQISKLWHETSIDTRFIS